MLIFPIFGGLTSDLFPNVAIELKRDMNLEKKVQESCDVVNEKKIVKFMIIIIALKHLKELIEILHSLFIIGYVILGKRAKWRALAKVFDLHNMKTETKY